MEKQIRSARIFTLAFVGDAEFTEGAGDCLALGTGSYGETVAVVEHHASPTLEMLRKEMDASELGIVNIIMLTGEAVTDKDEMASLAKMAGRQVDIALRGIFAVSYLDKDESKVNVKVSRRGGQRVTVSPRYADVLNREFYCLGCRNDGREDCNRTVRASDMREVVRNGRTLTVADCPVCGYQMTRTGKMTTRREMHGGLSERSLVFEPPAEAYCLSCKQNVKMIWLKAVRYSDEQPRPSYRANCFRCLGMVGTPWQRTRVVPVKSSTLEKLVDGAKQAEDALYEERAKAARKRRNQERHSRRRQTVTETQKFQQSMLRLRARYKVA